MNNSVFCNELIFFQNQTLITDWFRQRQWTGNQSGFFFKIKHWLQTGSSKVDSVAYCVVTISSILVESSRDSRRLCSTSCFLIDWFISFITSFMPWNKQVKGEGWMTAKTVYINSFSTGVSQHYISCKGKLPFNITNNFGHSITVLFCLPFLLTTCISLDLITENFFSITLMIYLSWNVLCVSIF